MVYAWCRSSCRSCRKASEWSGPGREKDMRTIWTTCGTSWELKLHERSVQLWIWTLNLYLVVLVFYQGSVSSIVVSNCLQHWVNVVGMSVVWKNTSESVSTSWIFDFDIPPTIVLSTTLTKHSWGIFGIEHLLFCDVSRNPEGHS